MRHLVCLFGEAERGEFGTPHHCKSLDHLAEKLGHPPGESLGIFYAVQALMFDREVVYFRVQEEGFSTQDYLRGIHILETHETIYELSAICMPGVGDASIIEATHPICNLYNSCLIVNQKDLYDYLSAI